MQAPDLTPRRVLAGSRIWAVVGLTALSACSGKTTNDPSGSAGSGATTSSRAATGGSASGADEMRARDATGGAGGGWAAGGSGGASAGGARAAAGAAGDAGVDGGQGGTHGDAATAGSSGDCEPVSCSGGSCCESGRDVPTVTCSSFDTACCSSDAECTDGSGGRCISKLATYFGCGGAVPSGNACNYDACAGDTDCLAATPAGASVAACVPAGSHGLYTAACIYGGCRTDEDCTLHPGGACQFGEAATHGTCDRRRVLFCAYPSDPCLSNSDCQQTGSFLLCLPEENYQGRHCAPPPPMYP